MKKATRYAIPLWYSSISKAALFDGLFEQAAAFGVGGDPAEIDPEVVHAKLREILEPVLLARGDPMPWETMKCHRLQVLAQAVGKADMPRGKSR